MICSAFWPSVLGSYLAPPGWMPTSEHHCGAVGAVRAVGAVGAVQLSAPGTDVSWLRQHLVELFQCGPRFEVNTGQHRSTQSLLLQYASSSTRFSKISKCQMCQSCEETNLKVQLQLGKVFKSGNDTENLKNSAFKSEMSTAKHLPCIHLWPDHECHPAT